MRSKRFDRPLFFTSAAYPSPPSSSPFFLGTTLASRNTPISIIVVRFAVKQSFLFSFFHIGSSLSLLYCLKSMVMHGLVLPCFSPRMFAVVLPRLLRTRKNGCCIRSAASSPLPLLHHALHRRPQSAHVLRESQNDQVKAEQSDEKNPSSLDACSYRNVCRSCCSSSTSPSLHLRVDVFSPVEERRQPSNAVEGKKS
jgi:hypothetical protein